MLLILNSTIGVTISMVYKYGDAILKTLCQPVVSSILLFLSKMLFDVPVDLIKISGAGSVIISTLLYLKLPSPPIVQATIALTAQSKNAGVSPSSCKGKLLIQALFLIAGVAIFSRVFFSTNTIRNTFDNEVQMISIKKDLTQNTTEA